MTNPVTVEGDGHVVEIRPLTIGDRIDRADLWERFTPELRPDASARDKEARAHRSNFIYVSAQSASKTLKLATVADTAETFDAKFAAFCKLKNAFYERWLAAVTAIDLPSVPTHQRPLDALTEAEQTDPE